MLLHKLKLTAMSLLLLAAVATGAGWLARSMAMQEDPVKEPAAPSGESRPRSPIGPGPTTKPDPAATARMTVAGRVLDPDGKPVKGAVVDLVTRPRSPRVGASDEGDRHDVLGQAQADADGRFQLDSPRTASTRVFEVLRGGRRARVRARLGRAESRRRAAHGRDPAPARAGRARPAGRRRPARRPGASRWSSRRRANPRRQGRVPTASPSGRTRPRASASGRGRSRPTTRGGSHCPASAAGSAVSLSVSDLRYARQSLSVDPAKASAAEGDDHRLQPARIIEGRVLAADTGQPIPNAVVSASGLVMNEHARGIFNAKFRADDQGRFAMNPAAGDELHPRRLPDRRRAVPDPAGRVQVDQGGGQGHPRHQAPPRRR